MAVMHLEKKLVCVVVERQIADPGYEHRNFLWFSREYIIVCTSRTGLLNAMSKNVSTAIVRKEILGTKKKMWITFTKNPPANMKVITVTEARVVAFFMSISVAPIASPSPCVLSIILFSCSLNLSLSSAVKKRERMSYR